MILLPRTGSDRPRLLWRRPSDTLLRIRAMCLAWHVYGLEAKCGQASAAGKPFFADGQPEPCETRVVWTPIVKPLTREVRSTHPVSMTVRMPRPDHAVAQRA